MLNSDAKGISMRKPISAITAMIAQSIQRRDFVSISVPHPGARRQELKHRDRKNHNRHHHCDRGRVADLETVESGLHDIDRHGPRRIARTAARENNNRLEHLQRADRSVDVALDDVEAGRIAANRLLELGHRRIVVIGGRRGVSSHALRLTGCRAAFRKHGLKFTDDQVRFANFTAEQAYDEARRCMTSAIPPTAIISLSNFMTLGVMRALIDVDRQCPGEVSLIGVDDLDWTDIMRLRPTLIAQPIEAMTQAAIRTLLDQIDRGGTPSERRILFPPTLVERASCGPPPIAGTGFEAPGPAS